MRFFLVLKSYPARMWQLTMILLFVRVSYHLPVFALPSECDWNISFSHFLEGIYSSDRQRLSNPAENEFLVS
jgi:hypothetical protein